MNEQLKKSILISYLIGAPIGIIIIGLTIFLPAFLVGEGIFLMLVLGIYGKAIAGLLISFLIALWIGGKLAFENIKTGKSLILTSFKYSSVINSIIWSVFILIVLITCEESTMYFIIPPIIAFIVCTIITTFTIGLLIASRIKRISQVQ